VDGPAAAALFGAEGTFSLRPERVRVVSADVTPPAGEASADGRLLDVVYAGATLRRVVALDAGPVFVSTEPSTMPRSGAEPRRGDHVRVTWVAGSVYRLN
jgi:putative spermidine/putrescine transport system ATP-binding protein